MLNFLVLQTNAYKETLKIDKQNKFSEFSEGFTSSLGSPGTHLLNKKLILLQECYDLFQFCFIYLSQIPNIIYIYFYIQTKEVPAS